MGICICGGLKMQAIKKIDNLLTLAEKALILSTLSNQKIVQDYDPYDQSNWCAFEHEIWRLGEEIRLCLKKQNHFKLQESQVNRIVHIATNPNAKRGRQSFLMLLGYRRYQCFSEKIVLQINDKSVAGHVIGTLYKMQTSNYSDVIFPFIADEMTWIRNKAKKYIEKYNSSVK